MKKGLDLGKKVFGYSLKNIPVLSNLTSKIPQQMNQVESIYSLKNKKRKMTLVIIA